MKKNAFLLTNIIITILFVLFQFFKYDLAIIADARSFGLLITMGLFDYFTMILYAVFSVISIVYTSIKLKAKKWKAFVPTFSCFLTLFFIFIFPMTDLYLKLDYNINLKNRIKTVEMVENGTISDYAIGVDKYKAPYRLTSYNGKVFTNEKTKDTDVMFYICITINDEKDKVIIYTTKDIDINEDFLFNDIKYRIIKEMDDNWYIASEGEFVFYY